MSIFEQPQDCGPIEFRNPQMRAILQELEDLGRLGRPCLLVGEPGTGKEYLAWRYADSFSRQNNKDRTVCRRLVMSVGLMRSSLERELRRVAARCPKPDFTLLYFDKVEALPAETLAVLPRIQDSVWLSDGSPPLGFSVVPICSAERLMDGEVGTLLRCLGKPIRVPSLHERQEDLPLLLGFFIVQALERNPYIHFLTGNRPCAGNSAFNALFEYLQRRFLALARGRRWPANLRDLRNAVECSILRYRALKGDWNACREESVALFEQYVSSMASPTAPLTQHPTAPTIPEEVQQQFHARVGRIQKSGSIKWNGVADFLAHHCAEAFSRSEFCTKLRLKSGTALAILQALQREELIRKDGKGRSIAYRVVQTAAAVSSSYTHPFAVPDFIRPDVPDQLIEECQELLRASRKLYLNCTRNTDGTDLALAIANELRGDHSLFYHILGGRGLAHFLRLLGQSLGETPDFGADPDCACMRSFIEKVAPLMARSLGGGKPALLLLDHVERLKNTEEVDLLVQLCRDGDSKKIKFLLIADNLSMNTGFDSVAFTEKRL